MAEVFWLGFELAFGVAGSALPLLVIGTFVARVLSRS